MLKFKKKTTYLLNSTIKDHKSIKDTLATSHEIVLLTHSHFNEITEIVTCDTLKLK